MIPLPRILTAFMVLMPAALIYAQPDAVPARGGRPLLTPAAANAVSQRHAFVLSKDGVGYLSNPSAGVWYAPFLDGVYRSFGFSSDGTLFLYLQSQGRLPGFSLHMYNIGTGEDKTFGGERVLYAAWSPARSSFASISWNQSNRLDLWIWDAAAGEGRRIASGMFDAEYLEWSSDGRRLLYTEMTPAGNDAFHTHSYDRRIQQYDLDQQMAAPLAHAQWARYQGNSLMVAGGQAPRGAFAVDAGPDLFIRDFAAAGGALYATVFEGGRPSVRKLNDETGDFETVSDGEVQTAIDEGVVVRRFTSTGVEYRFVNALQAGTQPLSAGGSYEMPFQGSAYLVQGGDLFRNGGCDGAACMITSHKNLLGYGLDWQQAPEDGMGNTHVLAVADGTVVATYNTVTCNSVSTLCRIGWDNYSSSCSDPNSGAGNYVIIAHSDGSFSLYGHLKSGSVRVSAGQTVAQGDYIADQGHSGSAGTYNNYHQCGDHLHFQRQTSGVVWGQSVATDYSELPCSLSCGTAYVSQNSENRTAAASLTVVLAPKTLTGGSSSTGNQVVLNAAAPAGGAVVTLASSAPGVAAVPNSITVPAGSVSATFSITTSGVGSPTPVAINADYNSQAASDTLTVGAVGVALVQLPILRVTGATPISGIEVDLTAAAPAGGTVVTLTSSNPAAVTVPASLTVPAGATSIQFTAQTNQVTASTTSVVTASAGGLSQSVTIYVDPILLKTLNVGTNPLGGGNTSTATVLLNGIAPPGGAVVNLSSSDPAASVPSGVTVAAGATVASFPITSTAVAAPVTPIITATYGPSALSAGITINPITIQSLTINPSVVIAGKISAYNGIRLSSPAPPGGAVVSLTSSDPAVTPPDTITLPAGTTLSPNFQIRTGNVSSTTTATITAAYAGSSRTGLLTVNPVVPASMLINAASVGGGNTVTGNKVTLNSAAVGDAGVQLTSSDPAIASVPATLTIYNGLTAALFPITSSTVTTPSQVTITATYNGTSVTGILNVNPIQVSGVNLAQTSIGGGTSVTGNNIALSYPAPPGGASITLVSSNPSVASVPAAVTVAQNAGVSPNFTITTSAVTTATPVTISATYAGVTVTGTLTVNPPAASAVTLQSAHVAGGLSLTATVSLTGIAPAGGAAVTLASSNAAVASVPGSVNVAAGATVSPSFTITTTPVANSTPLNISATYGGVTQQAILTVDPTQVVSISLSPAAIGSGNPTTSNTVTLNGPAPAGGAAVALTSSNSSAASPPTTVMVPAGSTVSPAFTITTAPGLTAQTTVSISAAYGGSVKAASLTVNPIVIAGLTLGSSSVGGGGTVQGNQVTLSDTALSSGAVITLSSSDPAAGVPASVTVPSGSKTATFPITTNPVTLVTPVTISASFGGATLTSVLTVTPPALSTLTLNTTRTGGGLPITGNTITLNGPAPAAGAAVLLTSSDPSVASLPGSVTVPAGGTGPVSFDITTYGVTATRSVLISAAYGGVTRTVTINVEPIQVSRISLASASIGGGNVTTTNVAVLNYPAPAGGLAVNLTSSNPSVASVPASVSVASGQTISAGFAITTYTVTSSTTVTVTASLPGGSAVNQFTVFPITLAQLTINPASVIAGGISSYNSVKLNTVAPPGGAVVTLTSSDPAAVVPATVTVAAGATFSPQFRITTNAVSAPVTATISASFAGATLTGNFTVNPVVPASVTLGSTTVTGGNTVTGNKVNLNANATSGGVVVALSSSNPSVASVPAAVTIGAGLKAVIFNITTSAVSTATPVTVTATLNGVTVSNTLTVQ